MLRRAAAVVMTTVLKLAGVGLAWTCDEAVGGCAPSKLGRRPERIAAEDPPDVERVSYLHLEYVGPERIYLVAAVDLTGDQTEHDVATRLRRIERELEAKPVIEEAVLTLATAEEPDLIPEDGPTSNLI